VEERLRDAERASHKVTSVLLLFEDRGQVEQRSNRTSACSQASTSPGGVV
jgi:hypothetical protein